MQLTYQIERFAATHDQSDHCLGRQETYPLLLSDLMTLETWHFHKRTTLRIYSLDVYAQLLVHTRQDCLFHRCQSL